MPSAFINNMKYGWEKITEVKIKMSPRKQIESGCNVCRLRSHQIQCNGVNFRPSVPIRGLPTDKFRSYLIIIIIISNKGLFGEKIEMKWNQDSNRGGLGMKLES